MTPARTSRRVIYLTLLAVTLPLVGFAAAASAQTTGTSVEEPDSFTSSFSVAASPDEVPAEGGGEPGASGTYDLRLNSDQEIICHDITFTGVTPPFSSPAPTANHIHDGEPGATGPAVWLFPNPEMDANGTLSTSGCLSEAFSGDAVDMGFSIADIEAASTGYYVDVHTEDFVPGAVRGQFGAAMPVGGVDTGAGGTAGGSGVDPAVVAGAVAATAIAGLALASQSIIRRRRTAGAAD